MSIPPKFAGLAKLAGASNGSSSSTNYNSVDLFLDFVCPFSAKLFLNFDKEFIPLIGKNYPGKFKFVIRPVVQPWHAPGSGATSEAFVAVSQVAPDQAWSFAKVLFEHQRDYFDTAIIHETRNEIYRRLAKLASDSLKNVAEDDVYNLLYIRDKNPDEKEHQNIDNGVTNNLKYFIRFHRALSVHSTPTVAVNGVITPSIESSTSIPDLEKIFKTHA